MAELRSGVRLCLDWGKARIGVAACDSAGILAYPVATVKTDQAEVELSKLLDQYQPIEVLVGLPIDLRGKDGIAAQQVRSAAVKFARRFQVPVRLIDERMSSATAARRLAQTGKDTRKQRKIIDQAAAVEILQSALEAERSGVLGELLEIQETL